MPWKYVDPFKVVLAEDETETLGEMLNRIADLSDTFEDVDDPNSRWYQWGDDWICLDDLELKANYALGTMFRLRLKDLSLRGGANGISDLGLAKDDGLGTHVAFLWDSATNIVWFQRDRASTTARMFFKYIIDRAGKAVGNMPMLRADAIKRAKSFKLIKKLVVGIRTDEAPKTGALATYLHRVGDRFGAARVVIEVAPNRGEFLDAAEARAVIPELEEMIGDDEDSVAKAHVIGRTAADDDDVFIDLLRDRNEFGRNLQDEKSRNPKALMQLVRLVWLDSRAKV